MKIDLRRRIYPEEYAKEIACVVCEVPFLPDSVLILDDLDYTVVCPECLEYLGKRNPGHFPTHEQYEAALRQHPEPIWRTATEARRAEEDGTYWTEWDRGLIPY